MPFIAIDSETELFEPGYKAPRPACWSYDSPTLRAKIIHADNAKQTLEAFLTGTYVLVGHNVAYDTVVMCEWYPDLVPLIFKAYDEDRITCTKVREQLIDIALGRFRGSREADGTWTQRNYSLLDLARRYLGKTLDKDTWRMRYGELIDLPIIRWPAGAIDYAIGDAVDTRAICEMQETKKEFLSDQFNQARAQFALALSSARGLRADPDKVEVFARVAEAEYGRLRSYLQEHGLVRPDRVNKKKEVVLGTADTKRAQEEMRRACEESRIPPILTSGGEKGQPQISLSSDACERVAGDPIIGAYSEFLTARKVLSNDVKMLREATRIVHSSYGLAGTLRTTSSDPNVQNMPKKGGIRDCFVPDEGYCFIDCDYPALELYTLAQSCMKLFGFSALAETLKADKDVHLVLAATRLGITYEEAVRRMGEPDIKKARQGAKPINYGLPGGLGSARTVGLALKDYNVIMTEEEAKEGKSAWLRTFPEMRQHLARVSELTQETGFGGQTSPFTGQVSSNKNYGQLANECFQALGAAIATRAMYLVARACFVGETALSGSYPVAFIHDEIICETPIAKFRPAAKLLAELMRDAANQFLVDVPMKLTGQVKLEPCAMMCWDKDAKAEYEDGELIICKAKT